VQCLAHAATLLHVFLLLFSSTVHRDNAVSPCTIHPAETSSQANISTIPLNSLECRGMLCQEFIENFNFLLFCLEYRLNCEIGALASRDFFYLKAIAMMYKRFSYMY
jgi:hypothetical protein